MEQSTNIARLAPTPIIFIRHGQTDWNAEGRMQGQQDIPLNDTGREQARRNGRELKGFLQREGLSHADFEIISSPMLRTRQTMDLVLEEMELEANAYALDDRLKEITFGAMEGKTIPEIKAVNPELAEARKADKWGFVPPEGESYKMLSYRIEGWLMSCSKPMIIVSHGGVMRVLRGLLLGYPTTEIPTLEVPQDQFLVWRDGKESWV
ncbi:MULTISPECIES: histidine phosphatase family protein [Pseudovibrio]|uniref:histidine phosphatase family protein n=1 Tax=Stappiaceae TaxID=2821832 RepID=UPI002366F310|nr:MULTISPECIES: histidine phosphatase family protein [Pseudovibrio]MDD7911205.1 histidine phosphatase family protein [Pseudovibrio exalbescens]MDX5593108.1 histidine phosphatase family protein [Pseudovibrio sp. SPO723]